MGCMTPPSTHRQESKLFLRSLIHLLYQSQVWNHCLRPSRSVSMLFKKTYISFTCYLPGCHYFKAEPDSHGTSFAPWYTIHHLFKWVPPSGTYFLPCDDWWCHVWVTRWHHHDDSDFDNGSQTDESLGYNDVTKQVTYLGYDWHHHDDGGFGSATQMYGRTHSFTS